MPGFGTCFRGVDWTMTLVTRVQLAPFRYGDPAGTSYRPNTLLATAAARSRLTPVPTVI